MINRDKYAEYLDSAVIHKFINELDPRLSRKIFSLKFHPPFVGINQRFFDTSYQKQGVFIVRNKETNEIVRFGFSEKEVRNSMYRYLMRLGDYLSKYDCAILVTHNGEQKQVAHLFKRVINFELEYHNYFILKHEIECPEDTKISIDKLERVFPYTGRRVTKKNDKEWTISSQRWISGVYLIWKDEKLDYIGKGKQLVIRLYDHFVDRSKYIDNHPNGNQYTHRHVYYPPEDIKQGRIKISAIPVYRKMVEVDPLWGEGLLEETDTAFSERISNLERRLIRYYKPTMNIEHVEDDKEDCFDKETFVKKEDESFLSEDLEDPPF